MKSVIAKALDIARAQIGVREVGTSNSGARVDAYLAAAGLGPGNPWCAAFTYFCAEAAFRALGGTNPLPRTGYCPTLYAWARDESLLRTTPIPGDIFLLTHPVQGLLRAHHTGFVTEVLNGEVFSTVEGNTNVTGGADGYGVFARRRGVNHVTAFVRWEAAIDDAGETYELHLSGKRIATVPVRDNRTWVSLATWAEALGIGYGWDQEAQALTLGGKLTGVPVVTVEHGMESPVRDLVTAAGLRLTVDSQARRIDVTR